MWPNQSKNKGNISYKKKHGTTDRKKYLEILISESNYLQVPPWFMCSGQSEEVWGKTC